MLNTRSRKIILKSLRWEKNIYSSFGKSPQSIINEQALVHADLVVGVFKSRLGTPTEEYESGSAEEIKRHIGLSKPTMVLFSLENVNPSTFDQTQYQEMLKFKSWAQTFGITFDYRNMDEFRDLARSQIALQLNENGYFRQLDTEEAPNGQVRQLTQVEKDVIHFLENLLRLREGSLSFDDFIGEIGDYRFERIVPTLYYFKILNAERTSSGFQIIGMTAFNQATNADIANMIRDVEDGNL